MMKLNVPLNELGESPVWDERKERLYWVDIIGKKLNYYQMKDKQYKTIEFNDLVGNVTLCENGDLLIALGHRIVKYSGDGDFIAELDQFELPNHRFRFNDGKCDRNGRLNIGTMGLDEQEKESHLYSMSNTGNLTARIEKVTISNGLCWNFDYTLMYYIDSHTKNIVMYKYDINSGALTDPKIVIQLDESEGNPDGMTIDMDGNLFVAHWGGAKISVWESENYTRIQEYQIPVKNVTCCTFGGKSMNELFVTTAKSDDEYPGKSLVEEGSIYIIKTDYKGRLAERYKEIHHGA